MLTLDQTELQSFSFGSNPEDKYYILINRKINPVGIDLARLSKADPRTFDAALNEMGCILMLSGQEVDELIRRQDVTKESMHESLYNLAVKEQIIK